MERRAQAPVLIDLAVGLGPLPNSRRADQTEAQPLPSQARTSTVAPPSSTRIRL
jgi:hypothetical protein